ncbi:epoxide hydrolase [Metarhizium album ARSEF 1941]|uniref:Epoxide hydrolase n=1 Tax=Metarhizium album (strain ARSEF 1941) TaxID=1081103 RepID=A0A0B2X4T6_METAS|nr:epoxide hydrolase [Metarhizium album ARSEF 1941]KHO00296.1 epoxide hydrolase [Metarhizium album ARSEF 1941]
MTVSEDAAPAPEEQVKLYTIHISSRYLNLTRQKLELTRLPHDVPQAHKDEWWEPKSTVEPLVDYWLDKYSWREQEAEFNATIPQFRTAIRTSSSDTPVRLHFIHSRSAHANAVPLLLIPPFPFTNLSLKRAINAFTTVNDPTTDIPFHLVIPSLPGLGFSDPITSNNRMIPLIAEMLNTLMRRIGYEHYLATNAAPSPNSVSDIDWRVINHVATSHSDSCLGVHLVSPPFKAPTLQSTPMEWIKCKAVMAFSKPMLGYSQDDVTAFRQQDKPKRVSVNDAQMSVNKVFEPNTLAYALCDSPTGLLLFILMVLRMLGPRHQLSTREIIEIAELTWLPGAEGTIRLLAHSASTTDDLKTGPRKPTAGITVFEDNKNHVADQEPSAMGPVSTNLYTCRVWGRRAYNIVSWQRVPGSPGLLIWERPEVIAAGVRRLAKSIVSRDDRLQKSTDAGAALLERVVVGGDEASPTGTPGTVLHMQGISHLGVAADGKPTAEHGQVDGDFKARRRPHTPLFPSMGELYGDPDLDNEDFSQSSSAGSPSTIKPVRSIA